MDAFATDVLQTTHKSCCQEGPAYANCARGWIDACNIKKTELRFHLCSTMSSQLRRTSCHIHFYSQTTACTHTQVATFAM